MPDLDQKRLGRFGLLLEPEDADTPILNHNIRAIMRAWIDEQSEETREALEAVGVKPRNTILFYGPPGTGKTTLAHHLCARIGVRMLLVSGHDIITPWPGISEDRIASMFEACAKVCDDLVIFLDEIDGLCPKRREDSGGGATAGANSRLITFMRMLDRYPGTLIAATNRYDAIDPAFLRRIEMKVPIEAPQADVRRLIILKYLSPVTMTDRAIDELTKMFANASPALIRQVMEGLKRDLVMSRLLDQDASAASVFARLRAGIQPADDTEQIPFWHSDNIAKRLAAIDWPPAMPATPEKGA